VAVQQYLVCFIWQNCHL